ncbi:two-component system, OmpR family, alkaline phosphatase synthesis response regulator PhoP [Paenibacillus sp. UNCCL117]|uniref:response regulator transcription factor n=1 Tax=unclassified Paenibacillus TaxID=185978 RepID=UPI00088D5BB1|nr:MULTISPECIES: response regulator transcription factor [unclassified Paenibacillus]SDD13987.1 two-component system, OmpR family, alkaline phosphatase synthesis response regulator PhoP [Paenibacillus sp. cl123]SFW34108.1 two-component system, OmpR family, alkaline phosphatase synthesis response regulator PhoP [Paenibacillus sp. UNCCL117]
MMTRQIVIVDDHSEVAEQLQTALPQDSFTLTLFRCTQDMQNHLPLLKPDMFLISRNNSVSDGVRAARYIRTKLKLIQPVILYGDCQEESDIISSLEAGADDYIPRSSSTGQIVARIQAHLRRSEGFRPAPIASVSRTSRGLEVDLATRSAWVNGTLIPLSVKEFDLLYHLIRARGRIVTLEELFNLGWGSVSHGDTRTVLVHISNLRRKLRGSSRECPYIITVRGVGYMFNSQSLFTDHSPPWSSKQTAAQAVSSS